jgi:predicted nucleotidyltransferase
VNERKIQSELSEIQRAENVKILYACESGSRAWGFPSADSDYDVRFIYVRSRDWYLSIDMDLKRDVIERPLSDQLDISGWDLRKAFQLLSNSNPPLLEWLNSPIIYIESSDVTQRIRDLLPEFYSPVACLHHYLHMARDNFREYLTGETVWVKKYFYVLRPLLAIKWIEETQSVAPVAFQVLFDHLITDIPLKQRIEKLVEDKRNGRELDQGPRIDEISNFIESELKRLETLTIGSRDSKPSNHKLNELFRYALDTVESSMFLD